ncbi:Hypothetical protein SMAX5B_021043 [Scophthalmus maximus]|uniref:Ig-like domain-containing protein n=1 Tax=Scophthalmus maximus TaxID=52904 RepID=A0A2U9CQH5_SCOMX|nr:immunoglobulin superfamily member 6 [Scophthalmus maximus]AWP18904.1 Hypothetical protein SMAX5B_021043 [Scophthalmus maximus]
MQGIMRSFTSSQVADMRRLLWFSLMLTHLPVTESTGNAIGCITQPGEEIRQKTGQVAILPCNISSNCPARGWRYGWFVFKENSHLRLNLNNPLKYRLDGASLHIKSLNTNDSGIYHCAAVWLEPPTSGLHHVGSGTALTVTGHIKTMARDILLWLSFVLLVIYSMAVVTLIILKKSGCNRRMCKTNKKCSTKKTSFRNVLQEMKNRRKHTAGQNSSQVEAASTEVKSSVDGIYQNVKLNDRVRPPSSQLGGNFKAMKHVTGGH